MRDWCMRVGVVLALIALVVLAMGLILAAAPLARFKVTVAEIVGPHQQVWLLQDTKHPEWPCLLIIEALTAQQSLAPHASAPTNDAIALTSQSWPCE